MILENGVGDGSKALVDNNNQLHVLAENETIIQDAVKKGNAYNVNTGWIDLTSSTESAVLYFKNEEPPVNGVSDISIDAIAIGIDSLGTTAGLSDITIVRNPSAGTIVDNAVSVDMNENRNFGSSNTLSSQAYKGIEGDTFTNGSDFAKFGQGAGTRGFYTVDAILKKGSSIGVKIDTQTSSGTTRLYVALILHRIDGNNEK